MPRFTARFVPTTPKYRRHRGSDQAVVTLHGTDFYLGPWGSKVSKLEYDRLIGEWLANGRSLPASQADLTILELCNAYRKFAEGYYVKNGQQTKSVVDVRTSIKLLLRSYGHTLAVDFGPLSLKAMQHQLIVAGHARNYINKQINRIRRMFRWAVSEQMLPIHIHQALTTVDGLREGRIQARETDPVRPVDEATVEAILPHLPPIVADMVRLQRLTGCRPAEVCVLRPCDVDTIAEIWRYQPESHKTEHHGRERVIFIGPKGPGRAAPLPGHANIPLHDECDERAHQMAKVAAKSGN